MNIFDTDMDNSSAGRLSASGKAFLENGYRVIGDDAKQINNTAMVVVEHNCGTRRTSKISRQKAEVKNWKICPTCHGAKQRSKTRSSVEILGRLKALQMKALDLISADISIRDRVRASCTRTRNGGVCGHIRDMSMRSLFHKAGGNGCPVCAGNTLNADDIAQRGGVFGLTLLNPQDYKNLDSVLRFSCANDHEFTNMWSNQRNRGCPQCTRSTGERLLMAVCRILWPDGEWQHEFTVTGLDPLDPERARHRYDVASSIYKVLIENHSPLHDKKGHPFFKEGRDYDDDLKMQAVDAGGKLEGWSYAVVRWSEEEIDQVLNRSGNQSAALMKDLDTALARQRYASSATPLRLPDRPPPTVTEFIREHSDLRRHVEIVEARNLIYQDNQFWAGSKSLYAYRCASCGYEDRMSAWSVEDRSSPCLSCGERQTWEGFVYACDRAGYPVVEPSVKIDRRLQVTLCCREHQASIGLVRSRVAKKLKSDPRKLCVSCTEELPNPVRHRPGDGQTWRDFVDLMNAHGWDVPDQDWRGTSISGARGGGIQKYRIVHRE